MPFRSQVPRFAGGLLLACALAIAVCDPAPGENEATDLEPILSRTFDSPDSLAHAVLEAFEREDVDTLKSLPLTKEEFRLYVWPRLPVSRPERGVPFEYGWGDLNQKSRNSIASNYSRYKGRQLELVSVGFQEGSTDYGTFTVHRTASLKVRDKVSGEELQVEVFGSVMEWKGKYKLFSYVTD